jgi:hypothetical protein
VSLCMPACMRPLPLQRTSPLRVNSFVQTRPQRSRLRHRKAPSRIRIRIAVHVSPRASPPAAVTGPAEGYFTCTNLSAAVLAAHSPPSGALGFAFSQFSAASPGHAFAPLSTTGLWLGRAGTSPEICIYWHNARECSCACVFIPGAPPLDLDIFF